MRAMKAALEQGLKSIEFDIWLTKDDKFAVIHGGDNGEMPKPLGEENSEVRYIFDHTYEEIQANHVRSKYFLNHPSK